MKLLCKPFTKILLLLVMLLGGCAMQQPASPKLVNHAFGFDARVDSKDTEVLAFKYGVGGTPQTEAPFWKDEKDPRQGTNINGPIPLGETLYVKWRTKSTNEIYEDLVNLKPLLPASMHRQRIYFVVQGQQLIIYLIDLTKQKPFGEPVVGPFRVQLHPTHKIYPPLTNN